MASHMRFCYIYIWSIYIISHEITYKFERLLLNLSALENEYMALVEERFNGDWLMDWGELTIIDIAAVNFIL